MCHYSQEASSLRVFTHHKNKFNDSRIPVQLAITSGIPSLNGNQSPCANQRLGDAMHRPLLNQQLVFVIANQCETITNAALTSLSTLALTPETRFIMAIGKKAPTGRASINVIDLMICFLGPIASAIPKRLRLRSIHIALKSVPTKKQSSSRTPKQGPSSKPTFINSTQIRDQTTMSDYEVVL